MINFNQDLAWKFTYEYILIDDPALIEAAYSAVVASCGENSALEAVKNCQCDSISYNDKDQICTRLVEIVDAMPSASLGMLFGTLIPEFLCLGQRAVFLSKDNGKASSESLDQGSTEDSPGS